MSVIVPTRNSERHLATCLGSIRAQTYPRVELIVVDNNSRDATLEIARQYTRSVFTFGPERSAQVNFGVTQAGGEYIYKVDADFELEPRVVESCVAEIHKGFDAVVVHNSPDVSVGWIARVRKFEVDMYKYDAVHSSARFVERKAFCALGGFDEKLTAGEDYDFQNRLNRAGYRTGFVSPEAIHLGEPTSLWKHLYKYYMYGKDFANYRAVNRSESRDQLRFVRRAYLRNWRAFVSHPILAAEFGVYNSLKYAFGGMGLLTELLRRTGKDLSPRG